MRSTVKQVAGPIVVRGRDVLRAAGYSLAELERAGLTAHDAARLGITLDRARTTRLGCNVIELHALVAAPHRTGEERNEPPAIAVDSIRAALQARLDDVRGRLSAALATSPDASAEAIAGEVRDLGDDSVAAERTEVRNALMGRDVGEIGELEAALRRLDSGGYGRCNECELDIEAKRLRALPAACRCGHCQAEFERRRAWSGRH